MTLAIMDIRQYTIRPAANGWTVTFTDRKSGEEHTAIFGTSKAMAKWVEVLDTGRKRADVALKKLKAKGEEFGKYDPLEE